MIAGILAREVVVARIKQHALMAARVSEDRRAELGAVAATDDQRTHRIGAEINAEGKHGEFRDAGGRADA